MNLVKKKSEPLFCSKFRFWTANGWAICQWNKSTSKNHYSSRFEPNVFSFIGKWLSHSRFKIWILSKKGVHPFFLPVSLKSQPLDIYFMLISLCLENQIFICVQTTCNGYCWFHLYSFALCGFFTTKIAPIRDLEYLYTLFGKLIILNCLEIRVYTLMASQTNPSMQVKHWIKVARFDDASLR